MPSSPYSSRTWQIVRLAVLERDERRCRIGDAGCTTVATHVDHIVSPKLGGPFFDPANLRAACEYCNTARGGRVGANKTNRVASRYPPALEW